jgi:hypothetical protein
MSELQSLMRKEQLLENDFDQTGFRADGEKNLVDTEERKAFLG